MRLGIVIFLVDEVATEINSIVFNFLTMYRWAEGHFWEGSYKPSRNLSPAVENIEEIISWTIYFLIVALLVWGLHKLKLWPGQNLSPR